jgi:rhamnogalacturonyl hydrolase YesR
MRARFLVASLSPLLAASCVSAADVEIRAPRANGLVLGSTAEVEVFATAPPVACTVDGAAVVLSSGWTKLPYANHWIAEVPLGPPGNHTVELVPASGASATVAFESTNGGSVAIGDLVAQHFLDAQPTKGMSWDWGPGVFLYGLHRFAQVSPGRAQYIAAIEDYYLVQQAQGLPTIDHPDVCTPALAALALERTEGISVAIPEARAVADYIARAPRNALGAIDHLGDGSLMSTLALLSGILAPWARSIWCDSLQMYALFATQWGNAEQDPALYDFGAAQPVIFASVLQDPASGLCEHAWDVKAKRPLGVRWLRGNGWVGASTVDILDELPVSHPSRQPLLGVYANQARGFLAKQMPHGLWDTIVDQPGAGYSESSGSALAAYALAKGARLGYAPPGARAAARHTFEALVARLKRQPDGFSMTQISGATDPFPAWIYPLVPRGSDKDYGVGAFLLLASELSNETWP